MPQVGNLQHTPFGVWSPEKIQGLLMWTRDQIHPRMADSLSEAITSGSSA